jgi:hypothetical protein
MKRILKEKRLREFDQHQMIGMQKMMTAPLIFAPRRKLNASDWSFHEVLSIVSNGPFQSLNPILEHPPELLEIDTVKKVCEYREDITGSCSGFSNQAISCESSVGWGNNHR